MRFFWVYVLCSLVLYSQPNPESLADKRTVKTIFLNANAYVDASTFVPSCTLVVEGDVLLAVGKNLELQNWSGFERRDLKGNFVYPAFIDVFLPMVANEMKHTSKPRPQYQTEKKGNQHWNQSVRPELQIHSFLNAEQVKTDEMTKKGIAIAQVVPQDGIVRGVGALVTMNKSEINNGLYVLRTESCMGFSFSKGSSTQEYPTSRMGAIALLRQFWEETKFYRQSKKVEKNVAYEEFNRLSNKPFVFEVNHKNDLFRADKLSKEWAKPFWIKTSGDEYQAEHLLKNLNSKLIVPVQLPAVMDLDFLHAEEWIEHRDLKHWQSAPFALAFIEKNKLDICLTAHGSKDEKTFFKNIRTFINHGATHEFVLKSFTQNPAQWLGINQDYGSLQANKKASFWISNAPLWDSTFTLLETWVDGNSHVYVPKPVHQLNGKIAIKNRINDSLMATFHISDKSKNIELRNGKKIEISSSSVNYFTKFICKDSAIQIELLHFHNSDSLKGWFEESTGKRTSVY
ncbi:MAG: hypothetical protein SNJ77_01160, partial [Cytophagales bacterium]